MFSLIIRAIFTLHIATFAVQATAEIYYCKDKLGKVSFKDSVCGEGETTLKKVESPEIEAPAETPPDEPPIPKNLIIDDDKPGKLIFADNSPLSVPYKIKVHEVRIITETDDRLVVDVIYTYDHPIPSDQIKIYVTPNHRYWSVNGIPATRGLSVGRANIGLSSSNLKKYHVRKSFTDLLNVRFEHYAPGKYKGVIWNEVIKYQKQWISKI